MNKNFFHSKTAKIVFGVLGAGLIAVLLFSAGLAVGFRKARFSYQWGENYHKNFGGPRGGFFRDLRGKDFIDAHGAAGTVLRVELPRLVVSGRDGVEKIVVLTETTEIRRFRDAITPGDIAVGETIVVIGAPNDEGQVEAKFIRVMSREGKRG